MLSANSTEKFPSYLRMYTVEEECSSAIINSPGLQIISRLLIRPLLEIIKLRSLASITGDTS